MACDHAWCLLLLSSSWLLQKSKARLLARMRSMVVAKTIKHSIGLSGHLVWVCGCVVGWCGVVLCGVPVDDVAQG